MGNFKHVLLFNKLRCVELCTMNLQFSSILELESKKVGYPLHTAVFFSTIMVLHSRHRNPEAHIAFRPYLHSKAMSVLDLPRVKDRWGRSWRYQEVRSCCLFFKCASIVCYLCLKQRVNCAIAYVR